MFHNCLNMKLLLFASYICFSLAYSNTPTQYHIQTDDGHDRYFRYQTYNGQYRKEKRFEDGTVIGTYGWVDANNNLRLYNYIADENGYRIISFKKRKVDPPSSVYDNRSPNSLQPSQQKTLQSFHQNQQTDYVRGSENSINDFGSSKYNKKQPEFVNSKLHPKLQPNYPSNQHRQVEHSEENDLSEEQVGTKDSESSSEFINSKIHPKLQPGYSSNQPSQKKDSEEYSDENTESNRGQSSPEFINSKMHPNLRPDYSGNHNTRKFEPIENTSNVHTRPLRRNTSPQYNRAQKRPKLRPLYKKSQRRQRLVSRKVTRKRPVRRHSNAPEFINSKIHPKLQPDYSNNNEKSNDKTVPNVAETSPTTLLPGTVNPQNTLQGSSTHNVKSTGTPEEFRLDIPGGKITIDFDLGNQYRKEKIFPDGQTIGEHGYVDPFGILRKTFYRSSPDGLKQKKVSYWVGTRDPS